MEQPLHIVQPFLNSFKYFCRLYEGTIAHTDPRNETIRCICISVNADRLFLTRCAFLKRCDARPNLNRLI